MLHDHCLSPLTLNPSPPHATIATCLWYGRRSQQYAGKRQDAVLASDSFGFIKCTWVYAVMDASVVGDKHWITYVHPVVATCTVVAILLHDMYPLTASAESCTDPVVSPAPVGSASVVVVVRFCEHGEVCVALCHVRFCRACLRPATVSVLWWVASTPSKSDMGQCYLTDKTMCFVVHDCRNLTYV